MASLDSLILLTTEQIYDVLPGTNNNDLIYWICLKEFYILKGLLKILKKDYRVEYKNNLSDAFSEDKNIQNTLSSKDKWGNRGWA